MDLTLVINALKLVVALSIPVLVAVLCGAIVAGVLRVVTQIEDQSIGFAGKLAGIVVLSYFAAGYFSNEIVEFTARIWGGSDFYH